MVRLITLYALALSVTAVLARPTHDLHPRHRTKISARACIPKSKSSNDTTYVVDKGTSDSGNNDDDNSSKDDTSDSKDDTDSKDDNSKDDTNSGDDNTDNGDNSTDSTDNGGGSTTGGTIPSGAFPAVYPLDGGLVSAWSCAAVPQKLADKTKALTLSDSTFKIVAQTKALPHPVIDHEGKKAVHAHFPKGAYDLKTSPGIAGGLSFYASGPNGLKQVSEMNAREVSFAYNVYFSPGFAFNMGGKLPGLYGGVNDQVARTASGGNHPSDAFSCRFMFRDEGKGELYCYLPQNLNSMNFCGRQMNRKCAGATANGKTYGATIGTGAWKFTPGKWNTVRQVLRLNDPGKRNGSMKVYVNGDSKPIINVQNVSFGDKKENAFRGLQVQTFFGGHEPVWASPKNQDIYFSDFTLVVQDTW